MTDEDLGIVAAYEKFVRLFGWIFREQPKKDRGIDAHVEIQEGQATEYTKAATGRLLGLQIKSGPSWLAEKTAVGYVYRGSPKDLHYWLNHSLPVLIVLHDPETDVCYWDHVTRDKVTITGANWKMVIPYAQKIEKSSEETFRSLAEKSDFEIRLGQLILAKPWMDIVQGGEGLFLEATILADGSGEGTLDLWVRDSFGNDRSTYHWPYFSFPNEEPSRLFPRLFPWADFRVDADMYKAQVHSLPNANMSPELDSAVTSWLEKNPNIIPVHQDEDQTVYSLQLILNPVGQAFIVLDQYLSTGV